MHQRSKASGARLFLRYAPAPARNTGHSGETGPQQGHAHRFGNDIGRGRSIRELYLVGNIRRSLEHAYGRGGQMGACGGGLRRRVHPASVTLARRGPSSRVPRWQSGLDTSTVLKRLSYDHRSRPRVATLCLHGRGDGPTVRLNMCGNVAAALSRLVGACGLRFTSLRRRVRG